MTATEIPIAEKATKTLEQLEAMLKKAFEDGYRSGYRRGFEACATAMGFGLDDPAKNA